MDDSGWTRIGHGSPDSPDVLAAHLRAVRWNSATAAERDLFQAPFRAGVRIESYQLLPLRKALRLPRVNLLIADDVGLGKTVEAALIVRGLLLRRRIDFIVVAAPPSMTLQRKDELEAKFGLAFTRGIATIRKAARQSFGDAKTSLRHRQQHDAVVRDQATAVEIGCDFLTRDRWKREWQESIFGHGGRRWPVVCQGVAQAPESYATSVP